MPLIPVIRAEKSACVETVTQESQTTQPRPQSRTLPWFLATSTLKGGQKAAKKLLLMNGSTQDCRTRNRNGPIATEWPHRERFRADHQKRQAFEFALGGWSIANRYANCPSPVRAFAPLFMRFVTELHLLRDPKFCPIYGRRQEGVQAMFFF
jgi:hypothetical protein